MNCSCHCSAKCGLLGGLEQKIMDILWSSPKPLKPSAVLIKLKHKYAYTTIMTVLKRMADKKIVKRQPLGNAFSYFPSQTKDKFAHQCLDDLFSRVINCYGNHALDSFRRVSRSLTVDNSA